MIFMQSVNMHRSMVLECTVANESSTIVPPIHTDPPRSRAQTGGAVGLRFTVFSVDFLHFGYAYALIGLEINIRLDLISNVCIVIPDCEHASWRSNIRGYLRLFLTPEDPDHSLLRAT